MYNIHTMKRVNYHLTTSQIEKLREISKDTGLSVAELIRRAVDEYLGKKKKKWYNKTQISKRYSSCMYKMI